VFRDRQSWMAHTGGWQLEARTGAPAGFVFTCKGWGQLWLLRARPIAARASTVRGMRAVYDKEGTDPCKCHAVYFTAAHYCECFPVTAFRTGINDDAGLWAGRTTALARTPVRPGQVADAHLKRHGAPSAAVVVAVTNGRLDGFALLTRTFGTWKRILCQLDG
jgi:hypothetical protein